MQSQPKSRISSILTLLFIFYSHVGVTSISFAENKILETPNSVNLDLSRGQYQGFSPNGDIRRFAGETLYYDVSFLFFNNAATAEIKFSKFNGHFQARLVAETKGFVGFFTNYRKHVYKSIFDVVDNGKRVRTRQFEREVIVGRSSERTVHYLDYRTRKHVWLLYKDDELVENKSETIPEGIYFDDVLAAFYNFRNEAYGKLEKGKNFKIDTIPDQSMKEISAYINSDEEKERFAKLVGQDPIDDLLLIKVKIPKDVFKTDSGELMLWTSSHLIPFQTTVKDYILLGDLKAHFKERKYNSHQIASNSN